MWLRLVFFVGAVLGASHTAPPTSALVVDKKTNTLRVCTYEAGTLHVTKTYHVTLGQVKGDKEEESDLKTPEGIYFFKSRLTPPGLAAKFGDLAFDLGFPNAFDRLAGRTGQGIMLHATNEPERLKQNYDSQGCVVVHNDEIHEMESSIRLGLTPILIFSDLSEPSENRYLKPGLDRGLRSFFQGWLQAWERQDLESYIAHYHTDFSTHGMNLAAWKSSKEALNRTYTQLEIRAENVHFYTHPKYSVVQFTQNYRARLPNGSWSRPSRGTKILYIAEEEGRPKIIAETFSDILW